MHHFALDGNEANTSQRVGSNVFAFEILTGLEKLTKNNDEVSWTVLLSSPPVSDLPKERAGWTYKVVGPQPLWTQFGLPIHLFKKRKTYSAFFTPGHYAPRISAVPYISSVMDLGFLKYPGQFRKKDYAQLTEWTCYSVRHATKVLAISEFTKKEVVKEYCRKAKDVFVAYPALPSIQMTEDEKTPASWVKQTLDTSAPYILYVGTLQPRKNLVTLVQAYDRFISNLGAKAEQPHLVIAGKIGWLAEDTLKAIKRSKQKKNIHLLGYVTDSQKMALYRKSLCTVLLGLYEGFGIPPLEALAANTIAVVSNSSSLPEVVGEAGFQVNPTNVKDIAEIFSKVLKQTAKQRATQLKKGREQVKKFHWADSCQTILDELISISKAPKNSDTKKK
jgi:glycosyltransferase involved in cell wall biosynthesis